MAEHQTPPGDPENDFYQANPERFDVVLCKDGVGHHAAKQEDFRRIQVSTNKGAFGARSLPEVEAAMGEGYNIVSVVPPGHQTEGERMARQRAHDDTYGAFDRSKI